MKTLIHVLFDAAEARSVTRFFVSCESSSISVNDNGMLLINNLSGKLARTRLAIAESVVESMLAVKC